MTIKKLLYAFVLPLLFFSGQLVAQERVVTGTVTDSMGSPVMNASILAKGTKLGTQTTATGAFSIRVPATTKTLDISSVGFTSTSVEIVDGTVNVRLSRSNNALSEVVVVAYGTRRKGDLTGAVTSISEKDFQKRKHCFV